MVEGLETGSRWGFAQGEGALVGRLYGTRIMSELVRDFLDGERTAEETAERCSSASNACAEAHAAVGPGSGRSRHPPRRATGRDGRSAGAGPPYLASRGGPAWRPDA
jgi:hypothetical protein